MFAPLLSLTSTDASVHGWQPRLVVAIAVPFKSASPPCFRDSWRITWVTVDAEFKARLHRIDCSTRRRRMNGDPWTMSPHGPCPLHAIPKFRGRHTALEFELNPRHTSHFELHSTQGEPSIVYSYAAGLTCIDYPVSNYFRIQCHMNQPWILAYLHRLDPIVDSRLFRSLFIFPTYS